MANNFSEQHRINNEMRERARILRTNSGPHEDSRTILTKEEMDADWTVKNDGGPRNDETYFKNDYYNMTANDIYELEAQMEDLGKYGTLPWYHGISGLNSKIKDLLPFGSGGRRRKSRKSRKIKKKRKSRKNKKRTKRH